MNPRRRSLAVLAGLALAAPAVLAADFQGEIERFESLRLAGAAAPVSGVSLASGNVTLLLRSGHAAPVKAGDEIVGLFFSGEGSFECNASDPVEHPVVLFNAKKNSGVAVEKADGRLTLRSRFRRLLWIAEGAGSRPEPGAGGPGIDLGGAFRDHVEKFRRARGSPLSHLLVLQRSVPGSRLVVAEVGGGDDLRYVYDDFERREESLAVLRRSESTDAETRRYLYPVTLAERPLGRDRKTVPDPLWTLTDVRLELTASGGRDAELVATETVVPIGRARRAFRFDLYNTTYAVVGTGALQPRVFRLRSVRDAGGKELPFHHAGDEVLVSLPEPAAADRPFTLEFRIDGDFLIRPGGDNYWLLGVEPWFPQPELRAQYYTLTTTVRVPKPFVPFAPGVTKSRRVEGDVNVLETRVEQPVQFGVILAGKYALEEQSRNGVTVRVATYAMANQRAAKQLLDLAFGIIEYYQVFLGPFPFPEFNIIEINSYGFGQAPPAVMFITKEAFNPYIGDLNQLFSQGINERFAHEIAHQYWGHVVKMPSFEEQWITESFAQYSAAIFLRAFKGQSMYNRLLRHWGSRARFATEAAPIPLANRVSVPRDFVTEFSIRTGLLYDKGAYLLAALHRDLGDQMFLTFMKSYQKSFRWKFGSTRTVAGMLEHLTKKKYDDFFEAHYWGTRMPPE
ncbi:MAG: M1 family metallopeptidase [Thermoanaerobaculia bacterium]